MFVIYYIIATILDFIDEKSKIYMNDIHFDIKQYYLIRLTKAGFKGDISFFKLYSYIYKVINIKYFNYKEYSSYCINI